MVQRLEKWSLIFFLLIEVHLFLWDLYAIQFWVVLCLFNLFLNLDRIIICFDKSLVMKGAWFPLSILCFKGACFSTTLLNNILNFSYASSLLSEFCTV